MGQWRGSDSKAERASGRVAYAVTMFLKALTLFHVKHLRWG